MKILFILYLMIGVPEPLRVCIDQFDTNTDFM